MVSPVKEGGAGAGISEADSEDPGFPAIKSSRN
jgi:hypothetical protein